MEHIKKNWYWYLGGLALLIALFVMFAPKKYWPGNLFASVTGTTEGKPCTTSTAAGSKPGTFKNGICVAN